MPTQKVPRKKSKPPMKKIEPLKNGEGLNKLQFNINKDIESDKKINPKKIFENYKKSK